LAGLYHFTTSTNQVKETNSVVDIGLHYVATEGTTVWVEDSVPAGANIYGEPEDSFQFTWVTSAPAPYSGAQAHQSTNHAGLHQHYFIYATDTLKVWAGDRLFCYVYLDPTSPPSTIMLQWYASDSPAVWHRVYWGADNITLWGARSYMGPLPATGTWVRLEVPVETLGLAGYTIQGMAYTCFDGLATWDYAGKVSGFVVPLDADYDGIPDYLEDRDGNGAIDSGETDWNDHGDLGLRVFISRPRNGSNVP
jgi:hypothetical protein